MEYGMKVLTLETPRILLELQPEEDWEWEAFSRSNQRQWNVDLNMPVIIY